ncbi:MAG: pyridoxamine 5'-phosphate oxidase family protein [Bryobacterales bacterium]|nr:pyridoxamine 5'-phosphate oxidase family protein [Bryobacterales bacterium]
MAEIFHSGEREIQERTGERDRAILNGRVIGGSIPAGARPFPGRQQSCVLGWVSPEGDVWSCFVTGPSGFAAADEAGTSLSIDLGGEDTISGSIPPLDGVRAGDHLGVLFVEFATRRRLRVNGKAAEVSRSRLRIDVAEAFPNCPKYIQRRNAEHPAAAPERDGARVEAGKRLNNALQSWITNADTFFVASAHRDGPVDASHRGGKPGFVRLHGEELYIPDYPGNSMFSTLGNFAVSPRAGLVFLDFHGNRQLQLTGDVRLDLEARENAVETGGTGRWWTFSPKKWIVSSLSPSFDWTLVDSSPFNP